VSAGVCSAGRTGTVVAGFGLAPAVAGVWASAEAPIATNINVAVSNDLMTGPGPLKQAQLSTSAWSATAMRRFSQYWPTAGRSAW
jgi:hypothetical protein